VKSIARETAERLFNHLVVKENKLYQNKDEIRIQFEFLDHTILVIKYNLKNFTKSYYLNRRSPASPKGNGYG
jgi:hypothetical protein